MRAYIVFDYFRENKEAMNFLSQVADEIVIRETMPKIN